ncbi:MAG: GNAT family N-acetyltransferase [Clostridiales bacterium]|nr:GNAT family N-acetyltransferase [Clostridiales bacterium]
MLIRLAQTSDFDGWMSLLLLVQESFPGLDFEEYRKALSKKIEEQEALVAEEGGQIIGTLAFSHKKGEIEFLAVHPTFRRHGAARALVVHMLSLFPKGSTVSVITYRDGDPMGAPARALYSRLGFAPGKLLTVFDYPCQELVYKN